MAVSPDAARELAAIPTASVALVTLSYPRDAVDVAAGASGILVPRGEGRLMTACSFGSRKWPHWSSPDHAVLRVSTGRYGDERALQLTDEDLVERLLGEVASALRTTAVPTEWRVSRWPAAFPSVPRRPRPAGRTAGTHPGSGRSPRSPWPAPPTGARASRPASRRAGGRPIWSRPRPPERRRGGADRRRSRLAGSASLALADALLGARQVEDRRQASPPGTGRRPGRGGARTTSASRTAAAV